MSEETTPPAPGQAEGDTVVKQRRSGWRWLKWIFATVALLLALVAVLVAALDSGPGHRFIADQIRGLTPSNGLRYSVGRIEGSIYGKAVLHDVRVRDPKGLVFYAPVAELDWRPFEWLHNKLDIRSLHIPEAGLYKLPETIPSGKKSPILPGFDILIGSLRVDTLWLSPRVAGQKRRARIVGQADVHRGRALIKLNARVEGSDMLRVNMDVSPDADRFDIDAMARGTADGVMARLSKLDKPIALRVAGVGKWSQWNGRALVNAGSERLIDLRLGNRAGVYSAKGQVAPGVVLKGGLKRLASPRVNIDLSTTLANRRFDGRLSLQNANFRLNGEGVLNLGQNSFRNLQVKVNLAKPSALIDNMSGRNIELRLVLDGGFSDGKFDYRASADRLSFGINGVDRVSIAGAGRLSKTPINIPIDLRAARITGVGDVAGGILANLSLKGVVQASSNNLVGNNLQLKSDKLSGLLTLMVDFKSGQYSVSLNGGLKRLLIPGLGIVDVDSRLSVVPGPGGKGTRLKGRGVAQMVRLDNAFFRSLTKGLPRIESDLDQGPDGVLHLRNLRLTSPALRLSGNGYRRKDGTFHFEGSGVQESYGPLSLILDGKIDKPKLQLKFKSPNAALGLSDVEAVLLPTAAGYDFTAKGGSRLGPFTGNGAILLPPGGQASIRVDQLDVSGTTAQGLINIVENGFTGDLNFKGGGLDGALKFVPAGAGQSIEGQLTLRRATLGPGVNVGRGKANFKLLLGPGGTNVTAHAEIGGLRRGSLRIGRLVLDADLRDGDGTVKAQASGSRGRAFDLDLSADIRGNRYAINATGTVDQKPIKLTKPAVLTFDAGDWRLAETQVEFNGGSSSVSGAFGKSGIDVNASLQGMPLSVLDVGYPGLALGGVATGTFQFTSHPGQAESGRVNMKVRGLTRSGLVLSSRPVDVGVAAVLGGGKAAARAVIASDGKTIGKAQLRLSPIPGGGTLVHRLVNAPAFAQLRYNGPADALWRLTGVELFDLSGQIAIGADVSGRLAEPQIRGSLKTDKGRLESSVLGTVVTNLKAEGSFNGSQLVLRQFAGDAGKGGRLSGDGTFDLAAAHGFGIQMNLNAQNAVLIDSDDMGATVTGKIKIESDGAGGTVSGNVTLPEARYKLGTAAAAIPIPQLNIKEINFPIGRGDESEDVNVKPWDLAINAKTGNLKVTGLGLTSTWSADLDIKGEPSSPTITGQANLIQGDVEFAGRQFDLQRGIIRFAGRNPPNPSLDISATTTTDGLTATIKVTGNADRPEISFSSVPALPQEELLSRLLFGTSITNLSAPEALQLAAAVAALNNSGGGLDPINAVRKAIGLDRLRILPADPTTGQQTAVAAGKYVTRRAYVEIISDGAGYSATRLEYRITRWLSLLATVSTVGRQSAGVKVSKDY